MHYLLAQALFTLVKIVAFPVVCVFSLTIPACVYAERKIAAYMQDRIGPNRVGPAGILQPIADALKFFFKEDVLPGHVDKVLYCIAPALVLIPVFMTFAPIPFSTGFAVPLDWVAWPETWAPAMLAVKATVDTATKAPASVVYIPGVIADLDMGLLFVFAVSSLSVYGIGIGGWASNNKYTIFGGVRAAAQMISYEITLGLSVLGLFILDGTLNIGQIVEVQADGIWHVVDQPLAFLIFLVSYFAETNRLPFDLPECETELVAGYHLEYSAMKFAMFFMAEYAAMFIASALVVCLFFGGWDIPFWNLGELSRMAAIEGKLATVNAIGILSFMVFYAKIACILLFFMLIRWTIPRFRYDQLMNLGWKVFLPLGLINLVLTAFIKLLFPS